jgi:hypothetical protein
MKMRSAVFTDTDMPPAQNCTNCHEEATQMARAGDHVVYCCYKRDCRDKAEVEVLELANAAA